MLIDERLKEELKKELVGHKEVAEILGWDSRKVATYRKRGRLPEPLVELASGPVWLRCDISNKGGKKMKLTVWNLMNKKELRWEVEGTDEIDCIKSLPSHLLDQIYSKGYDIITEEYEEANPDVDPEDYPEEWPELGDERLMDALWRFADRMGYEYKFEI